MARRRSLNIERSTILPRSTPDSRYLGSCMRGAVALQSRPLSKLLKDTRNVVRCVARYNARA